MNEIPVLSLDEIQEDRPMPSRNHSFVAHRLSVALDAYRDRFTVHQQLSIRLDGWPSIPDVCLYPTGTLSTDWTSDEDEITIPPALAIEIVSPKQNIQPLLDKMHEYHRRGVKSCWIVEPGTGSVSVFPASGRRRAFGEGEVKDDVLGINISLADILG